MLELVLFLVVLVLCCCGWQRQVIKETRIVVVPERIVYNCLLCHIRPCTSGSMVCADCEAEIWRRSHCPDCGARLADGIKVEKLEDPKRRWLQEVINSKSCPPRLCVSCLRTE